METKEIEVGLEFDIVLIKALNTLSEYARVCDSKQNYQKANQIRKIKEDLEIQTLRKSVQ